MPDARDGAALPPDDGVGEGGRGRLPRGGVRAARRGRGGAVAAADPPRKETARAVCPDTGREGRRDDLDYVAMQFDEVQQGCKTIPRDLQFRVVTFPLQHNSALLL